MKKKTPITLANAKDKKLMELLQRLFKNQRFGITFENTIFGDGFRYNNITIETDILMLNTMEISGDFEIIIRRRTPGEQKTIKK